MPPSRQLRVLIPGGTGRVGFMLAKHLHQRGHIVSTITRFPKPNPWESIHWDAENIGDWATSLEGADAVINLATRFPQTTELIAKAIKQCRRAPAVWMNRAMEQEEVLFPCDSRQITLRISPIMTLDFGWFPILFQMARLGFGGQLGSGDQIFSWIHEEDFVRSVEFLIDDDHLEGAIDITSPRPIPNCDFMADLRDSWSAHHFGLPIPALLVKAFGLGGMLESRQVMPHHLLEADFLFSFPDWQGAARDLVQRWRQTHER